MDGLPAPIAERERGILGGLNLSSQHWVEGCCDGGSAAFGSGSAGQAEVAWSAACGAAGAPAGVLGIYRRGFVERGRGDGGGGIAAGRGPMVSRGGWDGAIAPVAVVGAALWAPSLICRAGGDRAVASAGFGRTRGRTPAGAGGIDGIAGAAAQRGDAGRQPGLPGDHRAVARRAVCTSTEAGEAGYEPGAADVCAGPASWCCGRSGRRRRTWASGAVEGSPAWATAEPALGYGVEPAADCRALAARLPRRRGHAHQPRGDLPSALRPGPRRAEA